MVSIESKFPNSIVKIAFEKRLEDEVSILKYKMLFRRERKFKLKPLSDKNNSDDMRESRFSYYFFN